MVVRGPSDKAVEAALEANLLPHERSFNIVNQGIQARKRNETRRTLEVAYPVFIAEVLNWLRSDPQEETPSYWAIADAIEREFVKDDDEALDDAPEEFAFELVEIAKKLWWIDALPQERKKYIEQAKEVAIS